VDPQTDPTRPPDLDYEDLPLWMRQARRRIDWGLIMALLLGLLSVWPFITRAGLPHGTALEQHVYRAAEMADVMQQGVLYTRWAPNLMYGYGLPLFNYVAPGGTYLATVFQLMTENSAVDGVRFVIIMAALSGALGVYLFVRRRWGSVSGVIAAGVWALSPFLSFLLPYTVGDVSLLLAVQLVPLVFWLIDRVQYAGRVGDVIGLSLGIAALLMAHEQAGLWLALLVGCWVIWLLLFARRPAGTQHWRLIWVCGTLGVGLAAIFWLPALLERDLVHWVPVGIPDAPLTFWELLSPFVALDFGAFNPQPPRNLGMVGWVFALGAVGGAIVRRGRAAERNEWAAWLFFPLVFAGGVGAGLTLQWNAIDVLALALFPLAVTASRMTAWLEAVPRGWGRQLILALLVGLPLFGAFATLHPPDWAADFGATDPLARLQLELDGYSLGTVAPGGWVPVPMATVPQPSRALIEAYAAGSADRVNREALQSALVDVMEHSALVERLFVRADQPVTIPLYATAFAGWQSTAERTRSELVTASDGLLQLELPSGDQQVTLYLGTTLPRTAGVMVSAVALLGMLIVAFRQSRRSLRDDQPAIGLSLLSRQEARTVSATLGGLAILVVLLVGQPGLFWRQSPRGTVLESQTPLQRYTEVGMDLLAYDLPRTTIRTGETLDLTLYWRAVRSLSENYQVVISLADAETGQRFAQSYKRHVGDYPTTRWPTNRYVQDRHRVLVPAESTPGTYLLLVELLACTVQSSAGCELEQPVAFFGERGAALGDSLVFPVLITIAE
jgi:hypothetical protein